MNRLKFYLKLYRLFFSTNLKAVLVYDKDALFDMLAMFLKSCFNLAILFFIFQLIPNLEGWTLEQVLLIYSVSMLSFAIWRCFYINTLAVGYYIRTGKLDQFLKRPVSLLFSIVTDGFDEDAWGDLLFSLVLLFGAVTINGVGILAAVLLIVSAIITSLVFAGITLLCSILSFFVLDNFNLGDLVYEVQEFTKYPLTIFSKGIQLVFTYVLPVALIAFKPVEIVLLKNPAAYLHFGLYWLGAIMFYWIVCKIWNAALIFYQSTGN